MNKERLLSLAVFLEQLPEDRFSYVSWVGSDWQGKPDLTCGTTACALGWATTMPELREAGLCLYKRGNVAFVGMQDSKMDEIPESQEWKESLRVASVVFDITEDEAECIFMPQNTLGDNATAKEVAEVIRYFVTHGNVDVYIATYEDEEEDEDYNDDE